MFRKNKNKKLSLTPDLYALRFYPSPRSYSAARRRQDRLNEMPPLMVRKPEWRR